MKITVIGTGYVGLVAGACLADLGNQVSCVDVDKSKIDILKKGEIPIYEPGLAEIVQRNSQDNRLSFSTDVDEGIRTADVIYIAVGTPSSKDGSADLQYVLQVAERIGKNLNGYKVVVNKSTVPVGTGDKVRAKIKEFSDQEFDVVSNPEFLKEGTAIRDFNRPDRIVLGVSSEKARKVMEEIYMPFMRNGHPVLVMDVKSAEITKYASNAMLATRISFMNEIANLCDLVGADVKNVRKGVGTDSRIGQAFLYAGIGYGGSCFPKDVKAIIKTAKESGMDFKVLNAVEEVNQKQKTIIIPLIEKYFKGDLNGKVIAIWGLAFKARTDDIREAPALEIISALLERGAVIRAADPEALENVKKVFGDKVQFFTDRYECIKGADALAVLTDWSEYQMPDFEYVKSSLNNPVVFDGRNLYDAAMIRGKGIQYFGIGSNI